MAVVAFSPKDELKKLAAGKKTKIEPELVIYLALNGYPKIQKLVGEAFGIKD